VVGGEWKDVIEKRTVFFTPKYSHAPRKRLTFSAAANGLLVALNLGIVPGLIALMSLHRTMPSYTMESKQSGLEKSDVSVP